MSDIDSLKQELLMEVERCNALFGSGAFDKYFFFNQSVLTEILIRLNHVLQKMDKNNNRIAWDDDVKPDGDVRDVTDLICKLRNAACHIESEENYINNNTIRTKFTFNTAAGKCPTAYQIGEDTFGCEYSDDVAFYYGDKRIYLIRHIKRLLDELPNKINNIK